jgi:hypothetical protein
LPEPPTIPIEYFAIPAVIIIAIFAIGAVVLRKRKLLTTTK